MGVKMSIFLDMTRNVKTFLADGRETQKCHGQNPPDGKFALLRNAATSFVCLLSSWVGEGYTAQETSCYLPVPGVRTGVPGRG
jgi:hypothetical protein